MSQEKQTNEVVLNEKSMEVLIAKFIPTSQYFEERFNSLESKFDYKFEFLQHQINQLNEGQKALKEDMDQRFEQVNKRFEQIDKRFEQIDKKFERIDKKFEQVDIKLDRILERIDTKIDNGLRENRSQSMRLFTFAMTFSAISMIALLGKLFGVL